MSKQLDTDLLGILRNLCGSNYNTPTAFDPKILKEKCQVGDVTEISHSLNNLQRQGAIRLHIGSPDEANKFELLKRQP